MSDLEKFYGRPDVSPFALFNRFRHFGSSFDTIGRKARESGAWLVGISSLFTPYAEEALATAAAIKIPAPGLHDRHGRPPRDGDAGARPGVAVGELRAARGGGGVAPALGRESAGPRPACRHPRHRVSTAGRRAARQSAGRHGIRRPLSPAGHRTAGPALLPPQRPGECGCRRQPRLPAALLLLQCGRRRLASLPAAAGAPRRGRNRSGGCPPQRRVHRFRGREPLSRPRLVPRASAGRSGAASAKGRSSCAP